MIRSSTDASSPFLLVAVKSTNKGGTRGTIKTYARCIKGFPAGQKKEKASTGQGQFSYKDSDVIPLVDLDQDKLRTIPISHIIGFNQYKVIH